MSVIRMSVISVVALTLALCPLLDGAERRYRPRFTLEQITETRTLSQFAVFPDGSKVAHTVSGYYFGFPVIPRFGEDNNIQMIDLETGETRKMTSGPKPKANPCFSPRGDAIAYESEGDLWIVEVATGAVRRVTVDPADDRDAVWAPDGKKLAFISGRGGQTDVWLTSTEGERHGLDRLTNDEAREENPSWSPDGDVLAFSASVPGEHYYASGIFLLRLSTSELKRMTPVDPSTNLAPRWSPGGERLAFLSDRSGYVHVWTMRPDGTELRELDTGPHDSVSPHFPVRPIWARDSKRILVSVNRDGRFDLVVIDVASEEVETVGSGGGQYHEVGWGPAHELLYVHENAWSPPDLFIRTPEGENATQLTFSSHATFRAQHFPHVERVRFPSFDGLELGGFLLTPSDVDKAERLPAIVNLHTNSYGQFYDNWSPFFHYLVESGFVMLMADQRGSAGYGRAFRDLAIGAWGTKTLEDVKAMADFVKSKPYVNPDRVGVMGLSHGGYLTLLALTKKPELFRAGVDLMGPTDRRAPFLNRNRRLHIAGSEEGSPELYDRVSPITSVERLLAPLLIMHSDRDRNVSPGMTYNFVDELERQNKAYEVVIYPDEAHGLALPEHQLDSYRRIVRFFEENLRTCPPR